MVKRITNKIPKPLAYAIVLFLIVVLTFVIEFFGFNFKSIRYGLKDTTLSNFTVKITQLKLS